MLTYEQNVKAILECIFAGYKDELIDIACRMICTLKDTEEQKLKIGHWIYDEKSDLSKCSICSAYCPHDELGRIETHYCSCCGAKMESEVKG